MRRIGTKDDKISRDNGEIERAESIVLMAALDGNDVEIEAPGCWLCLQHEVEI